MVSAIKLKFWQKCEIILHRGVFTTLRKRLNLRGTAKLLPTILKALKWEIIMKLTSLGSLLGHGAMSGTKKMPDLGLNSERGNACTAFFLFRN